MITLGVKYASNSVRWSDRMKALKESFGLLGHLLRILDDYLRDRYIIYEVIEAHKKQRLLAR